MIAESEEKKQGKKRSDPYYYEKKARLFLRTCGTQYRFWNDQFYSYNGFQYLPVDGFGYAVRTWMHKSEIAQNNTVVGNIVPVIATLVRVQASSMPCWLTPGRPEVVAYKNGLLDLQKYLETGECLVLPHSTNWFSTACLPFDFIPESICPQWIKFLREVYDGDEERIALLQEFFGYCLTPDTRYQKALVMLGMRRGGKGTIQRILEAMLGSESYTAFSLPRLAERFGVASLVNKHVATIGEVNLTGERDRYRIYETLNSIIGEDAVPVEVKHKQGYSTRLPTKFVISCNEMPHFYDNSGAFASRLLVLNHDVSFECRADPQLLDRLLTELPGISVWAMNGLKRLRTQNRFTVPARMRQALRKYLEQSCPVLPFLADCCLLEAKYDSGGVPGLEIGGVDLYVSKDALFNAWGQWCNQHNHECGSLKWFSRNLQTLLPKMNVTHSRDLFIGIALKQAQPC